MDESLGTRQWLLWQLADSGFPTGGFAHSGGLEAATHAGLIPDQAALEAWLLWSVDTALSSGMGLLNAAHAEPERILEWDTYAHSTILSAPARRASMAVGNGLLSAAAAAFPQPCAADKALLRRHQAHVHHLPVLGLVSSRLQLPLDEVQQLYAFQCLRDGCSAAVRLNRCGPLAAQGIIARLAQPLRELVGEHHGDGVGDIACSGPLVELMVSSHDALYSRLFQS